MAEIRWSYPQTTGNVNEHSKSAFADARNALLKYLQHDLRKKPFDCAELSEQVRPNYTAPQEGAYQLAHAYCHKSGFAHYVDRIAIDYYADTEFNACADLAGDIHLVCVSAGVPMLLTALFCDVLQSTNPFSIDYGGIEGDPEPGDYKFPTRITSQKTPNSKVVARLIEKTIRESVPELRWQKIWAVTLAEIAVTFVFAHELGHLVRGHTAAARKRGPHSLLEVQSSDAGNARYLRRLRNIWEIEADETAFGFLWGYMITTRANRLRFARRLRCDKSEHVEVALIARLIYAVSFVFLLLGQAQTKVDPKGTHPSALVRITYLMAMAQTILERFLPEVPPEQTEKEIQNAHSQAEAAWNRLGLEFGVAGFKDTIDDLPIVVNRMERRRERLSNILRPFAWKPQGSL